MSSRTLSLADIKNVLSDVSVELAGHEHWSVREGHTKSFGAEDARFVELSESTSGRYVRATVPFPREIWVTANLEPDWETVVECDTNTKAEYFHALVLKLALGEVNHVSGRIELSIGSKRLKLEQWNQ